MNIFDETELDQVIQTLAADFLADADETLQGLWDMLDRTAAGDVCGKGAVVELRRQAHNFKGLGGSFGFPAITLIAHRLEDYIDGQEDLDTHHLGHTRSFIEALQDIVDSKGNPSDDECALIVRRLPAKGAVDKNFMPTGDHEILVVVPALVLRKAVEGQLHSRGFRVVTLKSPLPAFEIAVRGRPDMIIASAMMEAVSGIDLACAFSAMEATSKIPFVLLTSFERGHAELRGLPDKTGILRHDLDLDGEITALLQRLG